MQALRMTAPSTDATTTEVAHIAEPTPGPGEVSVAVTYAGINFIDVMARRGDPGYASGWPYLPGLEIAGTVRAVGPGVADHRIGDRVAAFTAGGGFAEVAVVPATLAAEVPATVPLQVAAAAPLVLSTAVLLLDEVVRLRAGESVLMHSASGGLGSAVAQVAAALRAGPTIGTVGSAAKAPAALAAGWQHIVVDGADAAAEMAALVPSGIDVVLDPSGTQHLDVNLDVAAPGARIVLFGNPTGETPAPLPPMGRLIGSNLAVAGFSISGLRRRRPDVVAAALRRALAMLAAGDVRLDVTVVDGLRAIADVHDLLAARRGTGKYIAQIA
jgi:NADPH2:quinone reductase